MLGVVWEFRYSFLRFCSPCNFLLTTEVTIRANTMMITNRAIRMPRQLRWFGLLETNWRRKRRRMWRRNKRNGNIRTINLKCAENNAEKYHNKRHVRHIRGTGGPLSPPLGGPNVLHHNKRTENNWLTGYRVTSQTFQPTNPKMRMQFGGQLLKLCIEFCCGIIVEDVRLLNRMRQLTARLIYVAYPNTHPHTHLLCTQLHIHTHTHTHLHTRRKDVCMHTN